MIGTGRRSIWTWWWTTYQPHSPNAVAAGAVAETQIRTADWGRIVELGDPFGHGICLIEFLGRGYDEIAEPSH